MKRQHQNPTGYFQIEACDIEEFKAIIDRTTPPDAVPMACDLKSNIPLYDMKDLRPALENPAKRREIMAEWAKVLAEGAGIVVLKGAFQNTRVLDEATSVFETIIKTEKDGDACSGDHFAASGANDRIWNSLEKLCDRAPQVFLRYFANTPIAAVCEAWLGPNYQMTAQVNLVHPGGAAQQAHRDYHLGFQTAEVSVAYPAHVHDLSPVLTLQGAVAHCDMPVESGPTKLLPFSQTYRHGYAAWRRDDFRAVFEERQIQLSLSKGDALFFNPATFHAAGANASPDVYRMANLLQVSSAFGRAMETIDRTRMCKALYPHAVKVRDSGELSQAELSAAVAATAEGYSFPTNLDRNPPVGGLASETQQAYFLRALSENVGLADFGSHLDLMDVKRLSR